MEEMLNAICDKLFAETNDYYQVKFWKMPQGWLCNLNEEDGTAVPGSVNWDYQDTPLEALADLLKKLDSLLENMIKVQA